MAGAAASTGAASAASTSSTGSASPVTETAVAEQPAGGVVHVTETTGEAALAPIGTGGGGGGGGGPIVTFIVRKQSPAGGAVVQRGSTVHLTVERFSNQ
jgi:hypothetical protein